MINAAVINAKGRFLRGFSTSPEITNPASKPPNAKINSNAVFAKSGMVGGEL